MGKPDTGHTVSSERKPTQGTETSKYLQERKSTETPLVVASERGIAQTSPVQACKRCWPGVVGSVRRPCRVSAELQKSRVVEASGKGRHRG